MESGPSLETSNSAYNVSDNEISKFLCVFALLTTLPSLTMLVRDIIPRTYSFDFLLFLQDSSLRNDIIFRSDYFSILIPFHFILFAREHGIGLCLFEETTLRSSLRNE